MLVISYFDFVLNMYERKPAGLDYVYLILTAPSFFSWLIGVSYQDALGDNLRERGRLGRGCSGLDGRPLGLWSSVRNSHTRTLLPLLRHRVSLIDCAVSLRLLHENHLNPNP